MHGRAGVALLIGLALFCDALAPLRPCAAPASPGPAVLRQESLRGSRQGQAGIVLDVNGDGREDLVIGAPYARGQGTGGAVLVYHGSAGGFPGRPTAILEGHGNLGWSLAALGDVPGLGRGVFVAGGFSGNGDTASLSGIAAIYAGGSEPRRVLQLAGETAMDKFGAALAAGDFNGDGIPDLSVGAPFHSPSPGLYQRGAVYVFFGPDYRPTTAVKIPATAAAGGIGFALAAGDVTGDGIDDLLLQASGKVLIHYGASGSFAPSPASPKAVLQSTAAGFGRTMAVLPDLDGDGCRDVAVAADQATVAGIGNSGSLFILRGGRGDRTVNADAPSPDLLSRIDGEPDGGGFGSAIAVLGNPAQGSMDLAISAVHADGNPWPVTGKIYLLPGASLTSGAGLTAARAIAGEARDLHLGAFLAVLGGGNRLAAGAPTQDADTGAVRIFDVFPGR